MFDLELLELHPPELVLEDAEAHLPTEAETDEELRFVLEGGQRNHVGEVLHDPVERVEVSRQLQVRTSVRTHLAGALLLRVRYRVGRSTVRMEDLRRDLVRKHERPRVLAEVDQILATIDVLVVLVEAVDHERALVDTLLLVGLQVVVAPDEERLDPSP